MQYQFSQWDGDEQEVEPHAIIAPDNSVRICAPPLPLLLRRLEAVPRASLRYSERTASWVVSADYADEGLSAFRATYPDGLIVTRRGVA